MRRNVASRSGYHSNGDDNGDERGNDNGDDVVVRLLHFLQNNAAATAKQISIALSISERKASRLIKQLKDMGKIRRIGSDRKGHWEIDLPENHE